MLPPIKLKMIDRAYGYFLKGLTSKEIAKLLDVSARTVQRWATDNQFNLTTQPKTLHQKAKDLQAVGHSYTEIAKIMKVSKSTVYNYLKA